MRLFDTHVHLLDERFDADRDILCHALKENGVHYALEAGTAAKDSEKILDFVSLYPHIYAALGTHPHDASDMTNSDFDTLFRALSHKKAVALGEIGLDYHYDFSPRDVQRRVFAEQLDLAQELHKPVVLHVRESTEDALAILKARKNALRGVMHCFSGSYEFARICIDMGLYIAFGGVLTYKNAAKALDIAKKLPMERLLIETDCPYMAPHPHRGERNEPAYVRYVCEKLSQLKDMDMEEAAEITLKNGLELFGIQAV